MIKIALFPGYASVLYDNQPTDNNARTKPLQLTSSSKIDLVLHGVEPLRGAVFCVFLFKFFTEQFIRGETSHGAERFFVFMSRSGAERSD